MTAVASQQSLPDGSLPSRAWPATEAVRAGGVGAMLQHGGLPCSVVRGFLDQTDAHDPTGEQRSAEAVDAVITRLLDR